MSALRVELGGPGEMVGGRLVAGDRPPREQRRAARGRRPAPAPCPACCGGSGASYGRCVAACRRGRAAPTSRCPRSSAVIGVAGQPLAGMPRLRPPRRLSEMEQVPAHRLLHPHGVPDGVLEGHVGPIPEAIEALPLRQSGEPGAGDPVEALAPCQQIPASAAWVWYVAYPGCEWDVGFGVDVEHELRRVRVGADRPRDGCSARPRRGRRRFRASSALDRLVPEHQPIAHGSTTRGSRTRRPSRRAMRGSSTAPPDPLRPALARLTTVTGAPPAPADPTSPRRRRPAHGGVRTTRASYCVCGRACPRASPQVRVRTPLRMSSTRRYSGVRAVGMNSGSSSTYNSMMLASGTLTIV